MDSVRTNLIQCVNAVIYDLGITRFWVQVKNKPCVRRTGYIRLMSWIHHLGSEAIIITTAISSDVRGIQGKY
jgi:hypothetical protein